MNQNKALKEEIKQKNAKIALYENAKIALYECKGQIKEANARMLHLSSEISLSNLEQEKLKQEVALHQKTIEEKDVEIHIFREDNQGLQKAVQSSKKLKKTVIEMRQQIRELEIHLQKNNKKTINQTKIIEIEKVDQSSQTDRDQKKEEI